MHCYHLRPDILTPPPTTVMQMKTLWTLLLTVGCLAATGSADAGVWGRPFGLGCSAGYHAHCDCHHGWCGWLHHLRGCRYHDGHGCKGKGKGKGAMPGYAAPGYATPGFAEPGYIAEPQMPNTYVPAPMAYPN